MTKSIIYQFKMIYLYIFLKLNFHKRIVYYKFKNNLKFKKILTIYF